MARNSENAPSEPSGRRRRSPEGASVLRQQFRDSIRDALSGVDVDELQGRATLRVPSDVSLLTHEAVSDLEAELAALRAERAELERRAQERSDGAPAVAVEEAPRWRWRRGRLDADEEEAAPPVAWSVERARQPLGEKPRPPRKAAPDTHATTAPRLEAPTAPSRIPLTDNELEHVVAPLLAELASLRTEVRQLRADPDAAHSLRPGGNRQLVKLIAGVLLGFALIVIALAVVLKA